MDKIYLEKIRLLEKDREMLRAMVIHQEKEIKSFKEIFIKYYLALKYGSDLLPECPQIARGWPEFEHLHSRLRITPKEIKN